MKYDSLISQIAHELDLPEKVVKETYKAYWMFIKDTIESLPLKEDMSEEEFDKLRTNFNVPSLGKLICTFDKYKKIKRQFEYIKRIKKYDKS